MILRNYIYNVDIKDIFALWVNIGVFYEDNKNIKIN